MASMKTVDADAAMTSRRSHAVRRLRAAARSLMTSRERSELATVLSRYRRTGNVADMADSLWALFDTTAKQRLIPLLRAVIPPHDRAEYDRRLGYEESDHVNWHDNIPDIISRYYLNWNISQRPHAALRFSAKLFPNCSRN